MIETATISKPFDYQKQGYFNNMITGLPVGDAKKLISFLSPYYATVGTIVEFKLIGINPVVTIDMIADVSKIVIDTHHYYYNASVDLVLAAECGIYYILIKDSLARTFRTGLFNVNLTGNPPDTQLLGDYTPLDYNNDYFTEITP